MKKEVIRMIFGIGLGMIINSMIGHTWIDFAQTLWFRTYLWTSLFSGIIVMIVASFLPITKEKGR